MRPPAGAVDGRGRRGPVPPREPAARPSVSDEDILRGLIFTRRVLARPGGWLGGGGQDTTLPAADANGNVPTLEEYMEMHYELAEQLLNEDDRQEAP